MYVRFQLDSPCFYNIQDVSKIWPDPFFESSPNSLESSLNSPGDNEGVFVMFIGRVVEFYREACGLGLSISL